MKSITLLFSAPDPDVDRSSSLFPSPLLFSLYGIVIDYYMIMITIIS